MRRQRLNKKITVQLGDARPVLQIAVETLSSAIINQPYLTLACIASITP
jgi:hypothetical protein